MQIGIISPSSRHLAEYFTILEHLNPSIHEINVVEKRRSTDFDAVKSWNVWSGLKQNQEKRNLMQCVAAT